MAREYRERIVAPVATPKQRSDLGSWLGETFRFHSPVHERDWQQQAFRQSVDPDRWQQQPPVDRHTQALLDGMPHLGDGQFFFGPDGKYRRVTADIREDRDILDIRRKAFNELAQSGVTWNDLAQYPDDQPHPGEAEALAVRAARRAAADNAASAASANKAGQMFGPEKAKPDLTRVAADPGLALGSDAADWGQQPKNSSPAPILVATTDKAVAGLPKEVEKAQPFVTPSPVTPSQRRSFNENLVGHPANDNQRPAANDNAASAGTQTATASNDAQASQNSAGKPIIAGGEAADEERQIEDRLFNWQRKSLHEPAPSEYAVHAVSDAGRFAYLEDMKDEWSRLLEQNPQEVFQSMTAEVEKLSNAAMQDFVSGYHRQPNPAEKTEIEDAVTKMVFAPAERWTKAGDKPNETVADAKPYIEISEGAPISPKEGFAIVEDVLASSTEASKKWGKAGNETTQRHVPELARRMLEELKRCGVEIQNVDHKFEKQIKISRLNKGARWSDFRIEFEVNGKRFALDVNHAAYLASRYTRTPGEQAAFTDIVSFRRINANGGEFADHEGAVISFPKIGKRQTEAEYLKQMDDFLKGLVDCKSKVKVRVTNPYDVEIIQRIVDGAANDQS